MQGIEEKTAETRRQPGLSQGQAMTDVIIADLDELTNCRDRLTVVRLEYEAKREAVLDKVRAELDALEAEFSPERAQLAVRSVELEDRVRLNVLALGLSVKATSLHAVFSKGRISWDSKGLEGFMVAHPEIGAFRKEGQAGVTIRTVAH